MDTPLAPKPFLKKYQRVWTQLEGRKKTALKPAKVGTLLQELSRLLMESKSFGVHPSVISHVQILNYIRTTFMEGLLPEITEQFLGVVRSAASILPVQNVVYLEELAIVLIQGFQHLSGYHVEALVNIYADLYQTIPRKTCLALILPLLNGCLLHYGTGEADDAIDKLTASLLQMREDICVPLLQIIASASHDRRKGAVLLLKRLHPPNDGYICPSNNIPLPLSYARTRESTILHEAVTSLLLDEDVESRAEGLEFLAKHCVPRDDSDEQDLGGLVGAALVLLEPNDLYTLEEYGNWREHYQTTYLNSWLAKSHEKSFNVFCQSLLPHPPNSMRASPVFGWNTKRDPVLLERRRTHLLERLLHVEGVPGFRRAVDLVLPYWYEDLANFEGSKPNKFSAWEELKTVSSLTFVDRKHVSENVLSLLKQLFEENQKFHRNFSNRRTEFDVAVIQFERKLSEAAMVAAMVNQKKREELLEANSTVKEDYANFLNSIRRGLRWLYLFDMADILIPVDVLTRILVPYIPHLYAVSSIDLIHRQTRLREVNNTYDLNEWQDFLLRFAGMHPDISSDVIESKQELEVFRSFAEGYCKVVLGTMGYRETPANEEEEETEEVPEMSTMAFLQEKQKQETVDRDLVISVEMPWVIRLLRFMEDGDPSVVASAIRCLHALCLKDTRVLNVDEFLRELQSYIVPLLWKSLSCSQIRAVRNEIRDLLVLGMRLDSKYALVCMKENFDDKNPELRLAALHRAIALLDNLREEDASCSALVYPFCYILRVLEDKQDYVRTQAEIALGLLQPLKMGYCFTAVDHELNHGPVESRCSLLKQLISFHRQFKPPSGVEWQTLLNGLTPMDEYVPITRESGEWYQHKSLCCQLMLDMLASGLSPSDENIVPALVSALLSVLLESREDEIMHCNSVFQGFMFSVGRVLENSRDADFLVELVLDVVVASLQKEVHSAARESSTRLLMQVIHRVLASCSVQDQQRQERLQIILFWLFKLLRDPQQSGSNKVLATAIIRQCITVLPDACSQSVFENILWVLESFQQYEDEKSEQLAAEFNDLIRIALQTYGRSGVFPVLLKQRLKNPALVFGIMSTAFSEDAGALVPLEDVCGNVFSLGIQEEEEEMVLINIRQYMVDMKLSDVPSEILSTSVMTFLKALATQRVGRVLEAALSLIAYIILNNRESFAIVQKSVLLVLKNSVDKATASGIHVGELAAAYIVCSPSEKVTIGKLLATNFATLLKGVGGLRKVSDDVVASYFEMSLADLNSIEQDIAGATVMVPRRCTATDHAQLYIPFAGLFLGSNVDVSLEKKTTAVTYVVKQCTMVPRLWPLVLPPTVDVGKLTDVGKRTQYALTLSWIALGNPPVDQITTVCEHVSILLKMLGNVTKQTPAVGEYALVCFLACKASLLLLHHYYVRMPSKFIYNWNIIWPSLRTIVLPDSLRSEFTKYIWSLFLDLTAFVQEWHCEVQVFSLSHWTHVISSIEECLEPVIDTQLLLKIKNVTEKTIGIFKHTEKGAAWKTVAEELDDRQAKLEKLYL